METTPVLLKSSFLLVPPGNNPSPAQVQFSSCSSWKQPQSCSSPVFFLFLLETGNNDMTLVQGYNARKIFPELYASLVLECTVSGGYCKHKTNVRAWHGIHLSHKKSMKYFGHRKLLFKLSKLSKCNVYNHLGY